MISELEPDRAPLPDWVLRLFPKPCRPRKTHRCRICDGRIVAGEECARWSGVDRSEGWWTSHAHPECYAMTQKWDQFDWESSFDTERPTVRMYWPKDGKGTV